MTADDLAVRLRRRYRPPEWLLLEQVASGTGAYGGRTWDEMPVEGTP